MNSTGNGQNVEGSFRLQLDTTHVSTASIQGIHISASIPADSPTSGLETILQNMPNIGKVVVSLVREKKWLVTFVSEVGSRSTLSLFENSLYDNGTDTPGKVILTMEEPGFIPDGALYLSDQVDSSDSSLMSYVIENIIPGKMYYVRTATRNSLGFGARRETAPASMSPPIQTPGEPRSIFNNETPPFLRANSVDSLLVQIGPPLFDGGSPLLNFVVEWDKTPEFNSKDGMALGTEKINARTKVCFACVTSFDIESNLFKLKGAVNIQNMLSGHRVISIYFSDDQVYFQFLVMEASQSEIRVAPTHIRARSLQAMTSIDGLVMGADIDLLGREYEIQGLSQGSTYFVRVSAQNGAKGTGKNVNTIPFSATPRSTLQFAKPPELTVVNKNTLQVNLSGTIPYLSTDIISFKAERFTRNKKENLQGTPFGIQHIVSLDSVGLGLTGGTFFLTAGDFTLILPGEIEVKRGSDIVKTFDDLSPYLTHGDKLLINDALYAIHGQKKILAGGFTLSTAYDGDDDASARILVRPKSGNIPFDVSSIEMIRLLENMQVLGKVDVRKTIGFPNGFRWTITFQTNFGPQAPFEINTNSLMGFQPSQFSQSVVTVGEFPDNYQLVEGKDSLSNIWLPDLRTALAYYVRVTATNDRGDRFISDTSPQFQTPGQIPGPPQAPFIKAHGKKSIMVEFEDTAAENGSPVTEYVLEVSESPLFTNQLTVPRPIDHSMQRISVNAYSLPWHVNSTFTLSMRDFRGSFTKEAPVLIGIGHRSSVISKKSGSASLCDIAARGDFISVGGQQFRICLGIHSSISYDENHLSICSEDGWNPAFYEGFDGNDLQSAPLMLLDTSLGSAKGPALGSSVLITANFLGSANDITEVVTRGDLIRIGHPDTGEIFRISTDETRVFDSQHVPLGEEKDPSVDGYISFKSLIHATYEVQKITIRAFESSESLTPSSLVPSGFRLRFGKETTYVTSTGGAEGCLCWDAEAIELKAELEMLQTIDSVEVTKQDIAFEESIGGAGVLYYITFSGLRGDVPLLEIIDVGSNGCLDASDFGGKFSRDIEIKSVSEELSSFLSIYKVQTTTLIPFDATASYMKAAIEELSLVCKVEVSRERLLNGFFWDVSFTSYHKSCKMKPSLVKMSANSLHLSATVDPKIEITSFQRFPVAVTKSGVPLYAKLSASNKFGRGAATSSNPTSVQTSTQPPTGPKDVHAEVLSDSEALVQWEAPLFNGGDAITQYRVEYDTSPAFTGGLDGAPTGSIVVPANSKAFVSEVQAFTVEINSSSLFLSGTFSLEMFGQTTRQLRFDSTADIVESALNELCVGKNVTVSRFMLCSTDDGDQNCRNSNRKGNTWLVTFLSSIAPGEVMNSRVSRKLKTFQIDGRLLYGCADPFGVNCTRSDLVKAYTEEKLEVQTLVIGVSPFALRFSGYTSELISLPCSMFHFERKIEEMQVLGDVSVSCLGCSDNMILTGCEISITFLSFHGDVPLLDVSDGNSSFVESVKGVSAMVTGRSTYAARISNLAFKREWYVRVFACNRIGCGASVMSLPCPLLLFRLAPSVLRDVAVLRKTDKSIDIGWNGPSSGGGNELVDFVIELSASPAFTSLLWTSFIAENEAEGAHSSKQASKQYGFQIDKLIPGIDYYFRIAARGPSNLTGAFSYIGYPGSPHPVAAASAPGFVRHPARRSRVRQGQGKRIRTWLTPCRALAQPSAAS